MTQDKAYVPTRSKAIPDDGALMSEPAECWCYVVAGVVAIIAYCQKHAAADDLLEALEGEHKALDWALARLIELDRSFYPSQSPAWPYLLAGNAAIQKARAS